MVSLRRAISLPSTRKTRGSPPGAARPATTVVPGINPSSMRRRATSSGSSRDSTTPDSPSRRSAKSLGTRLSLDGDGAFGVDAFPNLFPQTSLGIASGKTPS